MAESWKLWSESIEFSQGKLSICAVSAFFDLKFSGWFSFCCSVLLELRVYCCEDELYAKIEARVFEMSFMSVMRVFLVLR